VPPQIRLAKINQKQSKRAQKQRGANAKISEIIPKNPNVIL
jgi:hypothetical protein